MGQHRTNPVALAAKRGDISKADRKPITKTPTHTERLIVPGKEYQSKPTITRRGRKIVVTGECLVRTITKVRGKANIKAMKRSRMAELKKAKSA